VEGKRREVRRSSAKSGREGLKREDRRWKRGSIKQPSWKMYWRRATASKKIESRQKEGRRFKKSDKIPGR